MAPGLACSELVFFKDSVLKCFRITVVHLNGYRILELLSSDIEEDFTEFTRRIEPQLFQSAGSNSPTIHFPLPDSRALYEKVMTTMYLTITLSDLGTMNPVFIFLLELLSLT